MPKNTVFAGDLHKAANVHHTEALATPATIKPGHILLKASGKYVLHNVAGQGQSLYIANLNAPKQAGMEDAYAANDTVQAFYPTAGELYNLRVAASQNITALETALTSNGDGTLKIASGAAGTEEVLAYADEIVNTGGAVTLVRVRIANFMRSAIV